MDIKEVLLQWFIIFFHKKASAMRAKKFTGSSIKD